MEGSGKGRNSMGGGDKWYKILTPYIFFLTNNT
jgi:hypothetical protein